MIKSRKLHIVFLIVAFFAGTSVKTMEQVSQNCEHTAEQSLNKKSARKNKTQRKRENRKHKKQQIAKENLQSEFENKIDEIIKTQQNYTQTLHEIDSIQRNYVLRLNSLGNLLYFQGFIINELRAISLHSKYLVETASSDNLARCFCINGKMLCGCDAKTECKNIKHLLTPEAQSIARELIGKMLYEEGFWDDVKLINDCYSSSCKLINHPNEEIAHVAKFVKNRISMDWVLYRIEELRQNILVALSNMKFNRDDKTVETSELISQLGINNIINTWLADHAIDEVTSRLMPDVKYIVLEAWLLEDIFIFTKNTRNYFKSKVANVIDGQIGEIIRRYEQFESFYKQSYEIIMSELIAEVDGCKKKYPFYKDSYFGPTLNLPESLEKIQLVDSGFKDYTEQERVDSFIAEFLLDNNKKPVKVLPKKKKSRRRHKRKKLQNEDQETESEQVLDAGAEDLNNNSTPLLNVLIKDEEQEAQAEQKLIDRDDNGSTTNYSPRILRWLKRPQSARRARSILYHAYPESADFYIKKYGTEVTQINRTTGLIDTAYYMYGRIKHANGEIETVIFGICFGSDGLCYHRGFDKCSDCNLTKEFAESKYNFDFPDLSTEQVIKSKKYIQRAKDTHYDECTEYESNIEIKDSRNSVVITLFK